MTSSRHPSPRLILAVVAFGVFVAADDLTVVSTMLRQIIFDLEIPLPQGLDKAAWIVNAYLIAYVVVMPFVGRLSDIVGRRAVYVGSLLLFLSGSIWVPLAPDLNSFIVGRVLTALGGGAMVPVAMAVIGDVYAPQKRATAMGTLGAIDTAGWVWGRCTGRC
ncbi:MAG: MFS transporter [Chloroflexota bacterium]